MRYIKSNAVIDDRLNTIVSKIKSEYKNGNIKTQTDYAIKIKEELKKFYNELGKPSMIVNKAYDIPSQENFVESVYTALFDIKTIMSGYEYINNSLHRMSEENKDVLSILLSKANNIALDIDSILNNDTVFSNNFTDTINTNQEENKASIDPISRMLMLPISNKTDIEQGITVSVLNTSNGFPGNTHEVYNNISSDIKFKGENNSHINIGNITFDGKDHDEWFELEMYAIDEAVKDSTNEIGFKYKEDVYWISEEDVLKLNIKFTLEDPLVINHILLRGVLKSSEGIDNPTIRKVIITDGETKSQVISYNVKLDDVAAFNFEAQEVKDIIFEIEQEDFVHTDVCRTYGINSSQLKSSEASIIEHDLPHLSIELLGLKYDTKNASIIYDHIAPMTSDDENKSKNSLFNKNVIQDNILYYNDIVRAMRYSIGISSIGISNRSYGQNGTYISKNYKSSKPIKSITLTSDDFIPVSFEKHLKSGESINKFIKYYISFDDENTWLDIQPRHKNQDGKCTVVLNSNITVAKRNSNILYIDTLVDVYDFKIKIELSRPDEINAETPYVNNYFLTLEEEGWF